MLSPSDTKKKSFILSFQLSHLVLGPLAMHADGSRKNLDVVRSQRKRGFVLFARLTSMEPDLIQNSVPHNPEDNFGPRVIKIRVTDQIKELQTVLRDRSVQKNKVTNTKKKWHGVSSVTMPVPEMAEWQKLTSVINHVFRQSVIQYQTKPIKALL